VTVTGVILAGGAGRRMGGVDKGLVNLAGKPLARHVLDALAPQVDAVLVSANRNAGEYRKLGCAVVGDGEGEGEGGEGYRGPLAGMLGGMKKAATPLALFVPCDAPFLPADLAARLRAAGDCDIAVAHDGERLQPVFCLLRTALADSLAQFLGGGGRKIDCWFDRHNVRRVDFSDNPGGFANINSPAELARAEEKLKFHRG